MWYSLPAGHFLALSHLCTFSNRPTATVFHSCKYMILPVKSSSPSVHVLVCASVHAHENGPKSVSLRANICLFVTDLPYHCVLTAGKFPNKNHISLDFDCKIKVIAIITESVLTLFSLKVVLSNRNPECG